MPSLAEQDPRYRRHEKRLARRTEFDHITKRQLARLLRIKCLMYSVARPVVPSLRATMRLKRDDIAWSIVDLELPA